jgi:hypothetical protein
MIVPFVQKTVPAAEKVLQQYGSVKINDAILFL